MQIIAQLEQSALLAGSSLALLFIYLLLPQSKRAFWVVYLYYKCTNVHRTYFIGCVRYCNYYLFFVFCKFRHQGFCILSFSHKYFLMVFFCQTEPQGSVSAFLFVVATDCLRAISSHRRPVVDIFTELLLNQMGQDIKT